MQPTWADMSIRALMVKLDPSGVFKKSTRLPKTRVNMTFNIYFINRKTIYDRI